VWVNTSVRMTIFHDFEWMRRTHALFRADLMSVAMFKMKRDLAPDVRIVGSEFSSVTEYENMFSKNH